MRGNMKKIAQVIGSKRLTADVLTVAETVRKLNRRFSFDVIIPKDAEYREEFSGIGARVISFEETQGLNARAVACFKRYFCENRADIVHTYASAGARVGARLAGIKTCISSRGFSRKGEDRLKRFASPIYNAFTTVTLCTSGSIFDALVNEGVRRDRIFPLLPSGIIRTGTVKSDKRNTEDTIIVCPLPFYRGFGQKTLLRAFSAVQKKRTSRLIFIGEGPEREECRLFASRLGIGGRVEFHGDETLTKVYNTKPSLTVFTHEESWELPRALLEGAKTPTVASDLAENKELFEDTAEFYLRGDEFSLERAMLRALSGADGFGAPRASVYTPLEAICEAHERIYTALLSL